jgi:hypothetical protein
MSAAFIPWSDRVSEIMHWSNRLMDVAALTQRGIDREHCRQEAETLLTCISRARIKIEGQDPPPTNSTVRDRDDWWHDFKCALEDLEAAAKDLVSRVAEGVASLPDMASPDYGKAFLKVCEAGEAKRQAVQHARNQFHTVASKIDETIVQPGRAGLPGQANSAIAGDPDLRVWDSQKLLTEAPNGTPSPLRDVFEKVADAVYHAWQARYQPLGYWRAFKEALAEPLSNALRVADELITRHEIWLRVSAGEALVAFNAALDEARRINHACGPIVLRVLRQARDPDPKVHMNAQGDFDAYALLASMREATCRVAANLAIPQETTHQSVPAKSPDKSKPITYEEAALLLERSTSSVSLYVKAGKLNPAGKQRKNKLVTRESVALLKLELENRNAGRKGAVEDHEGAGPAMDRNPKRPTPFQKIEEMRRKQDLQD